MAITNDRDVSFDVYQEGRGLTNGFAIAAGSELLDFMDENGKSGRAGPRTKSSRDVMSTLGIDLASGIESPS